MFGVDVKIVISDVVWVVCVVCDKIGFDLSENFDGIIYILSDVLYVFFCASVLSSAYCDKFDRMKVYVEMLFEDKYVLVKVYCVKGDIVGLVSDGVSDSVVF